MIEIKKGQEPGKLLQYRKQQSATYADMPSDVKQEVIAHLLAEQGHLCAYCMRRIDSGFGKHRCTIEHCLPQTFTDETRRLEYGNMLAVCWGNRDAHSNDNKTCDARRGSLTNPVEDQLMKKLDVFNGHILSAIEYKTDGTIFSQDPALDEDLNKRLNLNCAALDLKGCRKAALQAMQKIINKRYPNRTAPKEYLQRLLEHYTEQSEYKEPFCGILIAWLEKKV